MKAHTLDHLHALSGRAEESVQRADGPATLDLAQGEALICADEDVPRALGIDDELLRAFIEGNDGPERANEHRVAALLKGLKTPFSFSDAAFISGPLYWGYRKCTIKTIPLVLIGSCLAIASVLYDLLWVVPFIGIFTHFIPWCFFYSVYRARAKRVIQNAREKGFGTEEETIAYIRKRGGTSYPRALFPLVLAIAVIALVVFILL